MKTLRIAVYGLVLLFANLAGVFIGFLAYHALDAKDQIGIQVPVAALISILLYVAWVLILRSLPFKNLMLQETREHVLVGPCSLFWNPVVFIPLHYFTQGYVSSGGNIVALAAFQIPVNAIAILVAWKVTQPKNGQVSTEGPPPVKLSF